MKTLYLLRHAKSSWDFKVSDHDRPLNDRGISDCMLVQPHYLPELKTAEAVFCSTANRAQSTLKLIAKDNLYPIIFLKEYYTFDYRQVLHNLKQTPNQLNTILLVGHNPAYHDLLSLFTQQDIENFSTAGLAKITFDIDDWSQLATGKLVFFWKPKNFKA